MTMPVRARGLTKRYGDLAALDSLDLELERGEIFGLIGPNGAGKTTTMRLLLDIIRPSSGDVQVLGQDPRAGSAELRRRIGYLPGELHLEGRANGRSLLSHFARISGPVAPGAIELLAKRLGVDLDKPVRKLSKGNKQKVGLIQAFMHQPELLVLDEPTGGLDPLVQQEFMALIEEASKNGQTVLLSSHVLSEIERSADRVGVLHHGKLVRLGALSDLRLDRRRHVKATLRASRSDFEERTKELRTSDLRIEDIPGQGDSLLRLTATTDDVDPVIKLLAGFEVNDLIVSEPVLEDTVLALYRDRPDDDRAAETRPEAIDREARHDA